MTLIINGKTYEAGELIAYVKTLEKENAELKQAKEGKVVERFEAYGQCRDSRRIAELEEKLKHAEENCINKTCVVFKDKEDCVAKLLELEKENAELKADNDARKFAMAMSEKVEKQLREENTKLKDVIEGYKKIAKWCDNCDKIAELKLENQKWKDEWQEQVQKAADEGYARTLQTMQLTKAKELLKRFIETSNPIYFEEDRQKVKAEAEQFLKDCEVEK